MVTCREAKGYYNCRHVHDYLGAIEYDDERLEAYYTEEGRINLTETLYDRHEYTLRDHLGNARVCIDQDGNLLQETHYYAYGLPMSDLSRTLVVTGNGGRDNKYQYNGIEHIDEYGLMTAQAHYRSLDLQLGLWHQVDPKAEAFYGWSPYQWRPKGQRKYETPISRQSRNDAKTFAQTNSATQSSSARTSVT